jgi:molybdopterin molybdotransferase
VCEKFAPGMISPLAVSNAFMMIDESVSELKAHCSVKIIPTRFSLYSQTPKELITYA